MTQFIIRRWQQYRVSCSGSISVEMVLMAPLLIWAVAATVVYFDGFRSKFNVQKSATTIADAISRELVTLEPAYIDGMFDLFEVLTPTVVDRSLRISSFSYDDLNDSHSVIWSEARGSKASVLENSDLVAFNSQLPLMGDDDRYILVELSANYSNGITSAFGAVLSDIAFSDFVAISPRFSDRTCFQGLSDIVPLC